LKRFPDDAVIENTTPLPHRGEMIHVDHSIQPIACPARRSHISQAKQPVSSLDVADSIVCGIGVHGMVGDGLVARPAGNLPAGAAFDGTSNAEQRLLTVPRQMGGVGAADNDE